MSKTEKILRQQIKELETLVELKNERIKELEHRVSVSSIRPMAPSCAFPIPSQDFNQDICKDGSPHSYDPEWNASITEPPCTKCGLVRGTK